MCAFGANVGAIENIACFSTFEEVHSHALPASKNAKKRKAPTGHLSFSLHLPSILREFFFMRTNIKKENVKLTDFDRRQNISINLFINLFL